MGRFARDTGLDLENLQVTNLQAATITANSSPVLTVANSTFDNTIYVAKNGDDANDGLSLATPKLTIKAALAAASSGTAVKVASGTYEEDNPVTVPQNCAVIGDDLRTVFIEPANPTNDFFLMNAGTYFWGVTVRNYEARCWTYDPAAANVFVSPYIQNITSSTTSANATCVYIDGSISSAISTKAMILGFMTIINRNGTGVHLVNQAYSQAVNIYTIAANVGILIESGSFATLNGSDCSIGNYGIIADGKTELYQGNVQGQTLAGNTTLTISNLSSFPRTNNGLIFDGDPNVYFISTFSNIGGNVWNVNVTSRLGNTFANGTAVTGYAVSTVSASAHTMEYVGAGTNPATALPQYGGIPIPENEVVETNDGRVNFTSTDQKGDFKIGSGLTINRATGTIEGDDFDRSLFAVLTPYILAIEGGFQ
jgi:hypothetical protein